MSSLTPKQHSELNTLQYMATWFGGYFNRRANEIINPVNDQTKET